MGRRTTRSALVGAAIGLVLGQVPATAAQAAARDATDTCGGVTSAGFTDVAAGHAHKASIDCLRAYRIGQGTGNGEFSPNLALSRGQTATFLLRTVELVGVDVAAATGACGGGGIHVVSFERLVAAGIVPADEVCATGTPITRSEMALWTRNAVRFVGVPTGTSDDYFTDDAGDPNEQAINEIAALGIVAGDGKGSYQPDTSLSRAQMATFLSRSLDAVIDTSTSATIDVFYVVPSGATAGNDMAARIRHEVGLVNGFYASESGHAGLRFARDGADVRVTTANVSATASELNAPAAVRAALRTAGHEAQGALLAYVEGGTASCSITEGGVAAIYLTVCNRSPQASTTAFPNGLTWEAGHELAHLLGAVESCAPNHVEGGHVDDSDTDLMWVQTLVTAPRLDVGNDDYYRHANPDCFDSDDNVHWDR